MHVYLCIFVYTFALFLGHSWLRKTLQSLVVVFINCVLSLTSHSLMDTFTNGHIH